MGTRRTFKEKFLKCNCYYCVDFPDKDEIKELIRTLNFSGQEMIKLFYYPTQWGVLRTRKDESWHRCRREYTINIYRDTPEEDIKKFFDSAEEDVKSQDKEDENSTTQTQAQT